MSDEIRFKPKTMEQLLVEEGLAQPGAPVALPGRTFLRKQGCYNCKHWDNGEQASKHFTVRRSADLKVLLERGNTFEQAEGILNKQEALAKPPKTGLCMKGGDGSGAEFWFPQYLCGKWDGRVGVEGTYDPLPQDLRAKLGEHID